VLVSKIRMREHVDHRGGALQSRLQGGGFGKRVHAGESEGRILTSKGQLGGKSSTQLDL